jgi:putative oxidoreductase
MKKNLKFFKQEVTFMKGLEKFSNHAYALMRIVAGFMFAFHGAQKIFGLFSTFQPAVGSQMWIGGIIELLGGLAIMLGFQTRIAAFLCSGEMAVAYFQFHLNLKSIIVSQLFPTINGGELAVLYCFVFLFIACRGGVKWCLDKTS